MVEQVGELRPAGLRPLVAAGLQPHAVPGRDPRQRLPQFHDPAARPGPIGLDEAHQPRRRARRHPQPPALRPTGRPRQRRQGEDPRLLHGHRLRHLVPGRIIQIDAAGRIAQRRRTGLLVDPPPLDVQGLAQAPQFRLEGARAPPDLPDGAAKD